MDLNDLIIARPGQKLLDHLLDVGNTAYSKLVKIDKNLAEIARIAGYLHDIGKIEKSIQLKLKGFLKNSFDHTFLSFIITYEILRDLDLGDEKSALILFSILSHHSIPHRNLLDNLYKRYCKMKEKIKPKISQKILSLFLENLNFQVSDVKINKIIDSLDFSNNNVEIIVENLQRFLNKTDGTFRDNFSKIYFALVSSDWESSSKFNKSVDSFEVDFKNILEKIEKFRDKYKRINPNYTNIHKFLFYEKHLGDRILVKLPTGYGKTSAAIFYSLKKNKKTIYTLPVSTIIEDIYKNKLKKIDLLSNKVSWYTSRYLSYISSKIEENEEDEDLDPTKFLFSKYLLFPFSVATLDRILLSMLNFGRYPIIDGSLSNSTLILDEPQLYSPEMLFMFTEILRKSKNLYNNTSILIMSATIPTYFLKELNELGFKFIEESHSNALFKKTNRTYISVDPLKNFEELVNLNNEFVNLEVIKRCLEKYGKIIIKLNTVKKSQFVYSFLKSNIRNIPIFLIHSRYITRDRIKKLNDAIKGEKMKKVILVTTQIIEAGVDLSYNCLLTELTPLDSIIQAAGRVNRRWEHNKPRPVFVFYPGELLNGGKRYVPYSEELLKITEEVLLEKDLSIFYEKNYLDILNEYYEILEERYLLNAKSKAIKIVEKFRNSVWGWKLTEKDFNLRNGTITVDAIPTKFYNNVIELINERNNVLKKITNFEEKNKIFLKYSSKIQKYFVKIPPYKKYLEFDNENKLFIVDLAYNEELGLISAENMEAEIYESG